MTLKQLLISLLTVFVVITSYYGYDYYKKSKKDNSISASIPIDTSVKPDSQQAGSTPEIKIINEVAYKLPEGEQVYNISHGKTVEGPRAEKISYNPLSITPGQKQIITISFPKNEIVSSGVIFITTDHQENQKLTLKKVEEVSSNNWQGEWTPSDTIKTRYNTRLYFVGPTGTYDNKMNFL